MIISLDEVKEWLRIDGEDDDTTLRMLINVSENYLKKATGKEFDATNEDAKLFCLVLITDWFENREFVGKVDNVRYVVKSILMQLEYGSDGNESS